MKTFTNSIWTFLKTFGQVRTAASLARQGKTAEALAMFGS